MSLMRPPSDSRHVGKGPARLDARPAPQPREAIVHHVPLSERSIKASWTGLLSLERPAVGFLRAFALAECLAFASEYLALASSVRLPFAVSFCLISVRGYRLFRRPVR